MSSPTIGRWVPGYGVPVIDERAVRVSAGLLFIFGAVALTAALTTGSQQPLQPFGLFFLVDMLLRITVGDRWSPTLAAARASVRRQPPQWVGAPQKRWAWTLGAALAFTSCAGMGLLGAPLAVTLALCSLCLGMLFLEAAFGYCVGCRLHQRFSRTTTMYCADGSCTLPTDSTAPADHAPVALIPRHTTHEEQP